MATRLLTHTQVLDDEIAALTEPTAGAFASAILDLASNAERRKKLGAAARRLSNGATATSGTSSAPARSSTS